MTRVWLAGSIFGYNVGGHLWVYLNWALGLGAAGTEVVYLEHTPEPNRPEAAAGARAAHALLTSFEAAALAIAPDRPDEGLPAFDFQVLTPDDVSPDDVLISLDKSLPTDVIARFRRSALIDIDPGITHGWIRYGAYDAPTYSALFTVGEGAARDGWQYVPPCVALDQWPVAAVGPNAAFTTVTQWSTPKRQYFDGQELRANDKTIGFQPYLGVPQATAAPVELAVPFDGIDEDEIDSLRGRGWRLRDAHELDSPAAYRDYVQGSLGEFSCAKPAYVELETAWLSDRTVCYLASGKPAVVQHTGPSAYLPDHGGLYRFRSPAEASACLDEALADYEENARLARQLAEEHFDARKVAQTVLEAVG